ncbi:NAD+ synthase [Candidatus Manganitrophus noduliformans]|uniref:Glutamine-dependent NAD(+) synthetase n=1 Tax=Candidatus Manganitrophus noduliformans TaxID=2606439 RepID=A0A7X6ICB9_9BACT|nr:NAD+ synthase [Candidatus Manganitrophus noduliformans]NKE72294.1 NAD+ synthase [Candidatus Manganitrophus noduliformans]
MRTLRLALAQINSTVGDLAGNVQKISEAIERAKGNKVDLIAFPELAISGYPPEDLLLKPQFIEENLQALHKVAKRCKGLTAIVGFVDRQEDIYNAAAVIHDGAVRLVYHKSHLPNYGVFDENRYFQAGKEAPVFTLNGITLGVNICEDIWYPEGPTFAQALGGGAEVIININASPYHAGKGLFREEMIATRARDNAAIIAYVNLVGGQDELVFDGGSFVANERGEILCRAKQFRESLIMIDLSVDSVFRARLHDPRRRTEKRERVFPEVQKIVLGHTERKGKLKPLLPSLEDRLSRLDEMYSALTLGLADYVHKNGFKKGVIGLSGGIDSALTAAIAVDALGKENVIGVFMPSRYTSQESEEEAEMLARNLGIRLITLPIESSFESYLSLLSHEFKNFPADITEENLQSRIRGNLMMALSNKFGWLVLTTGNKSELSVGYATLYGDMAGGFGVIKDVWKTLVYELATERNKKGKPVIPERTFTRPPTAELRPNQTDQDSLPPYELLDPILKAYVEEDKSYDEIVAMGFDPAVIAKVIALVDLSEFKRRQAPPGIKLTPRALGKDRRMPITNRYRSFYQAKKNRIKSKEDHQIIGEEGKEKT